MRDYARVIPTYWTGDTGKEIRDLGIEAQLLGLYLMTNPHANMFGLYYLPLPFIVHETGLSAKKVGLALAKLQSIGFCRYDAKAEFIWVVEMATYQIGNMDPEDNRLKGLRRAWEALPNNPFSGPFFEKYGSAYGLERRASKGLNGGTGSPQIIEQEKEQDVEGRASATLPLNLPDPNKTRRFIPPTLEDVKAYCAQRKSSVDPEKFFAHYESVNWFRGRTKLSNWKMAVATWEKSEGPRPNAAPRQKTVVDHMIEASRG